MGFYDSTIHLITAILRLRGIPQKRLAMLYGNLATAQAKKHLYLQAKAHANTSLEIIRKLKPQEINNDIREKKYQSLWNLAEIQSLSGDDSTAAIIMDQALQCAFLRYDSSFKDREAGKILIARGRISERMGKLQEALSYYHKALSSVTNVDTNRTDQLPAKESLYTENTIMEALDAKAGLLQKLYRQTNDTRTLELAISCYDLSFEVEGKLMQGFGYDESLARQAHESRQRSEKAIAACYRLFTLTTQHGWIEKAFLFAEKSKAVVLLESIRKNIAANNAAKNDTLLQQMQILQQEVVYFEKKLYENADTAEIKKLTQQKYNAENELLQARTALMNSKSGYREALLKPDSFSITALKDKLPANSIIAEFFEGKDNTWCFIVAKDSSDKFLQYDAGLNSLTDTLLGFFSNASSISNEPARFQQIAYNVYSALKWQQIDKGWKQVIIIPDGRFSLLPFDALITQSTAALNLQQAAYLIHKYEPAYAYSAAILLKQIEQPASSYTTLTAFAPLFANSERNQQPLQSTKQEIASIRFYKEGKDFIGSNASLSNFRKALTAGGILHIATHAYSDTSASRIPRIEFIDSSLLLTELYVQQTSASLVVLSACETGIGLIDKSEGPISLARGFYYAGAGNVITSYWSVDDESTAQLFAGFYRNINKNSYSHALHSAKLDYLKNASAVTASPYYWAGFVHIGQLQKQDGATNKWWWLLLIPCFIIAGFIYKKSAKQR
jgi:CHAT domain-containing protein